MHWRWWPIVSEFVFSQRQQSFSASMHGNNNLFDLNDGGVSQVTRMCDVSENYVWKASLKNVTMCARNSRKPCLIGLIHSIKGTCQPPLTLRM